MTTRAMLSVPLLILAAAMPGRTVFAADATPATPAPVGATGAAQPGRPVTLGGFGHRVVPGTGRNTGQGANGDTWDSAWLADDRVIVQHDDGQAWGKGNQRGIGELLGSPENPPSISGVDLNPGKFGKFLTWTYSTGTYEVDGVLYHIKCYSDQTPGNWRFYDNNILKSTDGGASWINHLGQTNTVPDRKRPAMFPGDKARKDPWQHVNFVKYGKGGAAPDVDNARTYVYLSSSAAGGQHLARVKRTDLPSLDMSKFQFYTGGDGMLDASWTNDIAKCVPVANPERAAPFSVVYNPGLGRYLSVSFRSDSWCKPPVESSLYILEAPHPWGPWTRILEENVNNKESDNLTWSYPLQKFQSADGGKMWMTTCGRQPYGLQFMPVYLTTSPVQSHEAEAAALTGTAAARDKAGFTGDGYAAGFDAAGDQCLFKVKAEKAGAYILNIRYNTRQYQALEFVVNGKVREKLKLGKSEQVYATWTKMSMFAWLEAGENAVAFRCGAAGEAADVNLDSLSLAFYSDVPGSLPGCGAADKK